jgi:hypothetical protein
MKVHNAREQENEREHPFRGYELGPNPVFKTNFCGGELPEGAPGHKEKTTEKAEKGLIAVIDYKV